MKKILCKKNIVLFGLLLFIVLSFLYINSKIDILYKINWNINIPNPEKSEILINEGFIDSTIFEKMYYSGKNINKLKNKEFLKKIEDNVDDFNHIYKTLVVDFFSDTYEYEQIINENLTKEIISNQNNYYALLERNERYEPGYCFNLLILDTENNNMYSLIWTS